MRVWDDGRVAISMERISSFLRLHPCVPEDDHPPFCGSGLIVDIRGGVAKVLGLDAAHCTRAHLRLIASALLEEGVHTLAADRAPGHRLPMARLETEGILKGWWTIDLRAVRLGPRARGIDGR